MKKYFKLLCFPLVCAMLLGGCGSAGNNSGGAAPASKPADEQASAVPEAPASNAPSAGAAPAVSGEITFASWGSASEKATNDEIIALFESKHPGTKVNFEYIPDEYATKIDTLFLSGQAPDVIYGHPMQFIKWADQGLLMDLTDRFNASPELLDDDVYITGLYESFKYEGKHIATVNGADTFLIYYNKNLFDEADVEYPNESWTMDDLLSAAEKLTKFDGNGKPTQYGISFGNDSRAIEPYIFANGGTLFDNMDNPQKVLINTPENVATLTMLQKLINDKYAPTAEDKKVMGNAGWDTGKVAMEVDGVYNIVYRRDITDFKWDIAALPLVEGGKIPALYAGYAIPATSKNPDLAWEFAKFMQSDEAMKLLASSGLITVINKKIANSDEVISVPGAPEHHILRVTTLDNSVQIDGFTVNWDEMVSKYFNPVLDQLFSNSITPENAAEQMQKGFEGLLNK